MADPRACVPCPLVREGYLADSPDSREGLGRERYVPVAWDTALDLAAEVVVTRFLGSFGMINAGHDWPTIQKNTELLVCFGGLPFKNAQVDTGGTAPHVDDEGLDDCLKAGVEVVSVSPIRHEHDNRADVQWLAPQPNSDVALMLTCAHWLIEHGHVDHAFLERCCVGDNKVIAYVMGESDGTLKTPAWAAALTELDKATIVDLARRMAEKRTLIAVAWAMQRADHGEQPFWMTCALAALLGGIGRPGEGLAHGLGTFNNYGVGRPPFRKAAFPQIKPGDQRYIPVSRVADMLLQPGSTMPYNGEDLTMSEIGLVWWAGGNPFHHHQDLHQLVQAFRRPDTVIVHDSVFQPTCRMADIVLPATTFLERNDWAASAHAGFFTPMHKLADPFGEVRNDHDICADLADRFGKREDFTEGRDEMGWIRHMWGITRDNARRTGCDLPDFETFWSGGMLSIPTENDTTAKLAKLREDSDAHPLRTPSGKIELFSETIAGFGCDDCPGHAVWREPRDWLGSADAAHHPLHLMSDQPAGRLHSQLDPGSASQVTKVRGREPCLIYPDDAAARGIADGDIVRIFNGRGACLTGAVVTERIRPGVINVAKGSRFDSEEPGEPSALERHVPDASVASVASPTAGWLRSNKSGASPSSSTSLTCVPHMRGCIGGTDKRFDVHDCLLRCRNHRLYFQTIYNRSRNARRANNKGFAFLRTTLFPEGRLAEPVWGRCNSALENTALSGG